MTLMAALAAVCPACGQDPVEPGAGGPESLGWSVQSPDGRILVEVQRLNLVGLADFPEAWNLYYRVLRDGGVVLDWSPLGITTAAQALVSDLEWVGEESRLLDERYEVLTGKQRLRVNRCLERILEFRNQDGAGLEVHLRAYDDGIAFRYRLPGDGPATVLEESSGFHLPAGAVGWLQPYDKPSFSAPAYERFYQRVEAGEENADDGWGFPALFRLAGQDTYLLLTEAGLDREYCGSRLDQTVHERVYRVRFPSPGEGLGAGEVHPVSVLPWTTPWRAVILGNLDQVAESALATHLSAPRDPGFGEDLGWVRPGRVAWSWWSQGTGDEALQRQYVDSAAEFGWEYVLVDARWDWWPETEARVAALAAYAESRGVGLILWYNSGGCHNLVVTETPRDRMHERGRRQAEFAKLSGWGVKGVKVDFFQSDKQDRIRQYLDILADARDRRLLVDFHGCTVPRGWERPFPNLMTMEAVRGAEQYKWSEGPSALDNVRLVLTRNVVGSMDYTPLTFEAALARRGITFAHQLALAVMFESGWQCFADRADSDPAAGFRKLFAAYPFVRDFLRTVPVAWDETRLLEADPDSHAVLARRHGRAWYLAGLNGSGGSPLALSIPLAFLDAGDYRMEWIRAGATPDSFVQEQGRPAATDSLALTLGPADGFVARLVPE